jgi:cytochrome c556
MRATGSVLLIALSAGMALAHSGVTGPTKVRMDLMSEIGDATKALGRMAKSGTFDAAKAPALAHIIATHAALIDAVFEDQHMHPKTEALPAIWQNWQRFSDLGHDLRLKADAVAAAQTPGTFKATLKALGEDCKSCHRDFRKD